MSRIYSDTADLTTKQPAGGGGMSISFRCPACDKNKPSAGRKLRRFLGLRTWVCAGCITQKGQQ